MVRTIVIAFFYMLIGLYSSNKLYAVNLQNESLNELSLTVFGDGINKEEATNNALRSAIEQHLEHLYHQIHKY